ncbi:MAG TPA: diguanylate cyclase, partial [Stenotrophomonas sp.]|nr:diguanylate cyclase [Stenotrophomonas sp.]
LRRIAQEIRAHARRPRDMAARFGGDEFALILPDTTPEGAVQVVQDLVARAQALEIPAGRGTTTHITVTVGVFTRVPTPGTEPRHFFEGADAALYQAKAAGRNGYAVDDGGLG